MDFYYIFRHSCLIIIDMSNVQLDVPVKKIELEAVIVRANGEVEELGTIAHWENKKPSFFKKIVRRLF